MYFLTFKLNILHVKNIYFVRNLSLLKLKRQLVGIWSFKVAKHIALSFSSSISIFECLVSRSNFELPHTDRLVYIALIIREHFLYYSIYLSLHLSIYLSIYDFLRNSCDSSYRFVKIVRVYTLNSLVHAATDWECLSVFLRICLFMKIERHTVAVYIFVRSQNRHLSNVNDVYKAKEYFSQISC